VKRLIRTYTELSQLDNFLERFEYLSIKGVVGDPTFGYERYLNQAFYRSREWKLARDEVIARDWGNDLGVNGFDIRDRILVHHMNPISPQDVTQRNPDILNPEFLISVTHNTHNAIHYGDKSILRLPIVERRPGDTQLWGNLNLRSAA
jgi:hypothetical protein